jgi:tRNA (guanine-N7-)-methyltransferase
VNTERRAIRSYVLRAGRITAAQKRALVELLPRYGVPFAPGTADLDALFGRCAPRVLEIGFGSGDTLVELAAASPGTDFIGVEVHPPGVGHCLLAVSERGLANVRVIMHDAVEVLEQMVPSGALDEVLLYFPDPWPKKRHHKRRIVQPAFAALVAGRLKPGGRLKLATDWEPYAAWMLEVLEASPEFANTAPAGGCVERPERGATRFERRGRRLGHRVFDLEFTRGDAPRLPLRESGSVPSGVPSGG